MPGDKFLELAMAQDRHVLDVLFRDAREAVTVQDQAGRLIYANDRAARLAGFVTGAEMTRAAPGDLVDRFEMIDESGGPLLPDSLPGRLLLRGIEPTEVTVGYRLKGTGKIQWSRVNASPIKNDAGEVVWAINFFLDITEQVRQQEGERLLSRITTILNGTVLSSGADFAALATALVPELAFWCGFHILDEADHLKAASTPVPASPDGRRLLQLAEMPRVSAWADRLRSRVISTGQREHFESITPDLLAEMETRFGAEAVELAQSLNLKSVVCVPLGGAGARLGTMTLVRIGAQLPFDHDDLALIDAAAERIGVTVTNTRLFQREHETAEALRHGLVPSSIPKIPGLEIAARYEPLARISQVGGDFFDVIVSNSHRYAVVVGDIEGKGVQAAAAVAVARQAIRTAISLEPDPAVVLAQLNQTMRAEPVPRMCTVAYMLLDRRPDHFLATVTLAGHPPPLLQRADGTVFQIGTPCPPAGVIERLEPMPYSIELYPGDVVVLYTDGVSRRDLPPPETVASLGATRPDEPLNSFIDRALEKFKSEVETVRDDLIMIAVRILGSGPSDGRVVEAEDSDADLESQAEPEPSLTMVLVSP